mmetsp:Transcript_8864/g.29333  ORF Transcript_8864/g.29333 Transcript_8864/m.29333 type:complete len:138 (+) Transcript_8864:40-453(+)
MDLPDLGDIASPLLEILEDIPDRPLEVPHDDHPDHPRFKLSLDVRTVLPIPTVRRKLKYALKSGAEGTTLSSMNPTLTRAARWHKEAAERKETGTAKTLDDFPDRPHPIFWLRKGLSARDVITANILLTIGLCYVPV